MKVGVAQINSERGEVEKNILNHERLIAKASAMHVDMIIFPELSLTGYEPDLANDQALDPNDIRLDLFQHLSDSRKIIIGVGAPTKVKGEVHISMIIFQPNLKRMVYSKQYLHPSETIFFSPAKNDVKIKFDKHLISFAICYELSVPAHSLAAAKNGSDLYIASVLNPVNGVDNDIARLSNIAAQYNMTVFMSNYVGKSGGYECGGKSTIWNNKGSIVGQLDSTNQGFLVFDTIKENVFNADFTE